MAPSTLGPVMLLKDGCPFRNEICSIRFELDMSLGDTTNPSTWSGTHGQSGSAHSCILLDLEPNDDGSAFIGEVLMMRPFGTGGRTKVQNSPFTPSPSLRLWSTPTLNSGRLRRAREMRNIRTLERDMDCCPYPKDQASCRQQGKSYTFWLDQTFC